MHTRSGTRPSEGQAILPLATICSTWVVVTTSGKVPKPHSGLLMGSKWVKPVARMTAATFTSSPLDRVAVKSPASPSSLVTLVFLWTVTLGEFSTRSTMRPMASFAHSPEGTSLA